MSALRRVRMPPQQAKLLKGKDPQDIGDILKEVNNNTNDIAKKTDVRLFPEGSARTT